MKRNNLVRKIYKNTTINKINKKIKLLGVNCSYNTIDFLNTRLILCLVVFGVFLVISEYGYILAPIATILTHYGMEYFCLDRKIKQRKEDLEEEALFFFEVLALTIESGRNLKGALDMTASNVKGKLGEEFKKTLSEVGLGKSLVEALKDMKQRIPSEHVNNVILNITESCIFGNNIVESLYNQVDYLRDKKLLDIKASIGKMPIKISVISVIFFVPLMMLIILSPIVIQLFLQ